MVIIMMNVILSTLLLLLLFTTPITVHSKTYIRRQTTEEEEDKTRSNDDPNTLNFNFSLQSTIAPTNMGRVADGLETFGTAVFEASGEYGDRFMWFTVEPLTAAAAAAVAITVTESRGGWRDLQQQQKQGEDTSSYGATLTLIKSREVHSTGTEAEDAKQFFLTALNDNNSGRVKNLDTLLGEWKAIDYVAPLNQQHGHTTGEEVVLPPNNSIKGESSTTTTTTTTPKTDDGGSSTTITNSENTTDESGGKINNNVIGIAATVFGICLVSFSIVAFAHRSSKKRKNNSNSSSEDPDHIGDLHLGDDKSANGGGKKWAAGLMLPARIKSNKTNNNTSSAPASTTTAAPQPVEVNEIDKVLADLHDSDDSSFISASSSAYDDDTSSGYSGLTGISDLNYQPKHDDNGGRKSNKGSNNNKKKLGRVEEMKPSISFLDQSKGSLSISFSDQNKKGNVSISFLDQSKGSLMKGTSMVTRNNNNTMEKESSFESRGGSSMGTAQSVRKEESFESDYRDKSAMATLNLRKDMLNTGLGEDDKARTISAQDNTEYMKQQRQVDKVRAASFKAKRKMRSGGGVGPVQKKEGDRSSSSPAIEVVSSSRQDDESRDQLLSSQLQKSDDLHINEIV